MWVIAKRHSVEARVSATPTQTQYGHDLLGHRHFPRKKKAAVPVQTHNCHLALSGLPKNGSRWHVPACAVAPHASGRLSSDREDRRPYPTIFILWGVELACMTLLVIQGSELAEAPGSWSRIEA